MKRNYLTILEFDKILSQLANYASTETAKSLIKRVRPSAQLKVVQSWQQETADALSILEQNHSIPIPGMNRLDEAIKRLELGTQINAKELAAIGRLLTAVNQVIHFFDLQKEEDRVFPALAYWYEQLVQLPEQLKIIQQTVSEEGLILSTASTRLARVRRQQQEMEQAVREKLNEILRTKANHLSDSLITIRNNRYVLPVKAEYRNAIGGTVHDQSATGQTLYMEPQAVVQMNNRRNELMLEEQYEINRILNDLSGLLMPVVGDLSHNERILGRLDFIQAKGRHAQHLNAVRPALSPERHVSLIQARHPLIPADSIVPNDIILGQSYRSIIITGPNTGGKTILLKTLGLLHLMGQSGLHIPAASESVIGLFDKVYADIGDEQSIEQSLSTFSSHMTNVVDIVNRANNQSLLLFDELGSGTDPQEGAALAMAILDYTRSIHATVMATTHYPELKVYAHETPETINASMEFDVDSLSPTYRLLIGIPGRSNAIEISRRLGLRSDILATAKAGVTAESQALNNLVANLEHEQLLAEQYAQETKHRLDDATQLLNDLRTEYNRWLDSKARIREQAIKEANEKVDRIQAEAKSILQEIRDLQLEQGQKQIIKEHVLIDKQQQLKQLEQPEHLKKNKVLKKAKRKNTYQIGDDVEVLSYGQRGTIIDQVDAQTYTVQLGILKMNIKSSDLSPLAKIEPKQHVNVQRQAGSKVSMELDLRGKRYETAMQELSQYLDQAILSNHPVVTIIHGIGTGAIRNGVQQALTKHPQVDRFHYSPANAGGNGATQVYFK